MAKTYQECYKIKDPKERLFAIMDRIDELKLIPEVLLSYDEDLELRNLQVAKMNAYSDWKDPE